MKKRMILSAISLATITLSAGNLSALTISSNSIVIEQKEQENELKLNKGKRWKANTETTTGVSNMINQMETFSSSKNVKNVTHYNNLAAELRKEMTTIFDKCSMKGDAHNNLHAFLVPIFGYLKELESDDLETCQKAQNSLDLQLKKYAQFFE